MQWVTSLVLTCCLSLVSTCKSTDDIYALLVVLNKHHIETKKYKQTKVQKTIKCFQLTDYFSVILYYLQQDVTSIMKKHHGQK